MKIVFLAAAAIACLSGCDMSSLLGREQKLSRPEIEALCRDVGQRAYFDDKFAAGPQAFAARDGAIAECKLKYLTGR